MKPPYSREVTGYVLISHVDVRKIVLPSLQIVRGRTLFKLNVQDDEFALIVTLSKMHNLEMPALRGNSPAFPSLPPTPFPSFFFLMGPTSPTGILGVSCGPSEQYPPNIPPPTSYLSTSQQSRGMVEQKFENKTVTFSPPQTFLKMQQRRAILSFVKAEGNIKVYIFWSINCREAFKIYFFLTMRRRKPQELPNLGRLQKVKARASS